MERIFEIEYTVTTVKNMSNVYVKAFYIKNFRIDGVEQECERRVSHGYINFKDEVKKLKRKYLYNKLKDKIFVFQVIDGQTKIYQSLSSSTTVPSPDHMATIEFAQGINQICDGIAKKAIDAFVLDGSSRSGRRMIAMQVAKKADLEYVAYDLTFATTTLDSNKSMLQDWEKGKVIIVEGYNDTNDGVRDSLDYLIKYEKRLILGGIEYIKNPNTIFIIETNSNDERNYQYTRRLFRTYPTLHMPGLNNIPEAAKGMLYEEIAANLEILINKFTKGYKGGKIMKGIKNVFVNEKEGVTVIVFNNGDKVRVTREKGEKNDVEKAIAIAIIKYYFGLDYYIGACDKVVKAEKKEKVKKTTKKTNKKEVKKSTCAEEQCESLRKAVKAIWPDEKEEK